jgi:glycosyltransferase involved in cell wall biosynthesis
VHNTECLLEWTDVEPDRVSLMQLSTPWAEDPVPGGPKSRTIIAVGRLVAAKGQLDLVDAVAAMPAAAREGLQVDLIGTTDASDPAYMSELRGHIGRHGLDDVVRLRLDLPDDELRQRFLDAAVFVSTSRHEGFCVPVIEALASGCRVVSTDAGALPETVGPCGTVVPVGDVPALGAALVEALDAREPDERRRAACESHLRTFRPDSFRDRLLGSVHALLHHA